MKEAKKSRVPIIFHFPNSFNDQTHESPRFYPASSGFHFKPAGMTGCNWWWRAVTIHSGAGRLQGSALPVYKLKEQRCQTWRDDCPGLLKALKLFSPQSVTAGCEDIFALLVLSREVLVLHQVGQGYWPGHRNHGSASWPQEWRCCAARRLPGKRNEEKDTSLQPDPHSKCNYYK